MLYSGHAKPTRVQKQTRGQASGDGGLSLSCLAKAGCGVASGAQRVVAKSHCLFAPLALTSRGRSPVSRLFDQSMSF